MSRFLQTHFNRNVRSLFLRSVALLSALGLLAIGACGEVTCPVPLSNVDGSCEKLDAVVVGEPDAGVGVESCDGVDNDGDDEVDEDWPELGKACGEGAGVGECVEGEYVCTEDGMGVVCEGAVGPSDEVCDGKDNDCDGTPDNGPEEICDGEDNDCDGLVDEGVLSTKEEVFDDHATVTAVASGFVVTRVIADQVRVETYDTDGNRTGNFDDIDSPNETVFLASDGAGERVLIALGKLSFHVVEVRVASDLVPIITGTQQLHDDWRQGMTLGVYNPPFHPRVLASPSRFLGYRNVVSFALNPIGNNNLLALAQAPTVASGIPLLTEFEVAGVYVAWEQSDNIRMGWLLDDGSLSLDIDVGRGNAPGVALRDGGPGVVSVENGGLRLSELGGVTLQCTEDGFCNDAIDADDLLEAATGPTGLAFDELTDTWVVVAGGQVVLVGRSADRAVVKQVLVPETLGNAPNRVDVAVSGGTAAVVQAAKNGDSTLTFLGCF